MKKTGVLPDIKTFAEETGLTEKQVRDRIRKGQIKTKKVKRKIRIVSADMDKIIPENNGDGRLSTLLPLKEQHLQAQIKKTLQGVEDHKNKIRAEYRDQVAEEFAVILEPLRQEISKMDFTQKQVNALDKVFQSTIKKLKNI